MDYLPEPPNDNLANHLMLGHAYVEHALHGLDEGELREVHVSGHVKLGDHLGHTHQRSLPPQEPEDEMVNNVLVTGAVVVALMGHPSLAPIEVVMVDGDATNQIDIYPDWMMSGYRVTVERIPGEG